ncbi:uncharacterized protein LOC127248621 [Andrographis paniculata]|uniref:uncharacterized protein LOC127248621 n=1 Tax=Andrographis paniculata TaxID=175694 RepID=UPI0021E903C3|nr:uncharacterized protein LOC127248621 [Andrographis paniculata]
MASLPKPLFTLYLLSLLLITSILIPSSHSQSYDNLLVRRRSILESQDIEDDDEPILIKKNKPKNPNPKISIKPTSPSKNHNQTKLTKPTNNNNTSSSSSSFKNQTSKPTKSTPFDSIKTTNKTKLTLKTPLKKLNSTSTQSAKISSDLPKPPSSKNSNNKTTTKVKSPIKNKPEARPGIKAKKLPSWIEDDDDDDDVVDVVSEFRDLPLKFQETFVPDLERISKTSQIYLTKYNREFTKGFKPYVGSQYAPAIASFVSFATIIIPLIFVSLIFNKIKSYFSIQKLLIFIQIYLSIYFTILGVSSLATGLEPLKFFYSASQSTYVCVQVLQTLAYVLYLLLLLMYLVLVFSTETGLATKLLGLAQTIVGFAVGLHYYITVFHRAVLRQPPKSSWKVHSLYATCFVVICLLDRMDRRKKAYLQDSGEEGKQS